jgi:6-pyruvoyl-tetrahydropterin synthase
MKITKQEIQITASFEGFHHWKDAYKEIEFLKFTHRHIFYVTVKLSVEHDDREVEFIDLKRHLQNICSDLKEDMPFHKHSTHSCEKIAKIIANKLEFSKPNIFDGSRSMSINVSEDNENSATVYFEEC